MRALIVLALLVAASVAHAQQSLEHKTCLFGAAEKLPKITGLSATQYRFVSPPGGPKAKAPGSDPLAVEIDATFLGATGTFLFVCVGQVGGLQLVLPQGIVK